MATYYVGPITTTTTWATFSQQHFDQEQEQWTIKFEQEKQMVQKQWAFQEWARKKDIRYLNRPQSNLREDETKV